MQNFTVVDIQGVGLAALLFGVFAVPPGYVLGSLTNILEFRKRLLGAQLLLSIAISVSVTPAAAYWIGRAGSIRAIWMVAGMIAAASVILLIRNRLYSPNRSGIPLAAIVAGTVWTMIAIGSLIDIQYGDRLYVSATIHDYSVRAPIAAAISRSGVLPQNPFFFPGAPVPLRYHYFWYILCGAVQHLAGGAVSPRQALIAGTMWCGLGLMAIIPLYLRFFHPDGPTAIRQRSVVGIAVLCVTGLDLIPALLLMKFGNRVQADLDWWNEQIESWLHSVLWVPHHVVALIACLTGFLLLWRPDKGPRVVFSVLLASLSFMTAVGCSVYVTLVFAIFLALWTGGTLVTNRRKEFLLFVCTGVLTLLFSWPHLRTLLPDNATTVSRAGATGSALFTFSVRSFTPAELLVTSSYPDKPWLVQLVNAAFLPVNYFLEFGFFFIIGCIVLNRLCRSRGISREQIALWTLLGISVLVCTFFRSSVIAANDLGWRGILFAQFVLILWSVDVWSSRATLESNARHWLRFTLLLGVAGTAYQGTMLRMFPILADSGIIAHHEWMSPDQQVGRRTLATRQAYEQLRSLLPRDALLQFNPRNEMAGYLYGNYAEWQTVVLNSTCGSAFGGNDSDCRRVLTEVSRPFEEVDYPRVPTPPSLAAVIFQDTDRLWGDRNAWIWKRRPLLANSYIRVIPLTDQR